MSININLVDIAAPHYASPKYRANDLTAAGTTISGTGFGPKPNNGGFNTFLNYEQYTPGVGAETFGYTTDLAGFVYVTTDRSHSGTKSIKCVYPTSDEGALFPTLRRPITVPTSKLYYSTWMYWEKIPTINRAGIFKLFRCAAGDAYAGFPRYYMTVQATPFGVIDAVDAGIARSSGDVSYAGVVNATPIPTPTPPATNGWHFMEWFCRLSTTDTSADGFFESWVDGVRVVNIRNDNSRNSSQLNSTIDNYITIFDGLDRIYDQVSLWGDEEYTDNTGCRVVMTNHAVYASSTKWAVQPITSWSNTNISITKKRSAFSIGESAYYHVFNDSGTLVHSSSVFTVSAD